MQVIYLDVLVLINLIVNYLLLLTTGQLAGLFPKRLRLAAAALFGAAYAALIFLPSLEFLTLAPIKLIFGAVMVFIAFGTRDIGHFVRLTLLFLAVSFAFGGCVTALYYFFGSQGMKNGVFYVNIPLKVLLVSVLGAYALTGFLFKGGARHGVVSRDVETVSITFAGKTTTFSLLTDNGNDLSDPATGRPVLLLTRSAAAQVLPSELLFLPLELTANNAANLLCKVNATCWKTRFRIIPYQALGTEGLLLAFRADQIQRGGKPYSGLVGISPTAIANGAYHGLIGV